MFQFTVGEVLTLVLAFLGAIGTVSMLVMNLSISKSVKGLQLLFTKEVAGMELTIENKISSVKLDVSALRTKIAEDSQGLYRQILSAMESQYANKQLSAEQHASNTKRLDNLEHGHEGIREELTAIRQQIQNLSERLPV